jgi:Rad3-related DNA helicase
MTEQSQTQSGILRHFVLKEPRQKQITAVEYIEKKYLEGYDHIVIAAPTGVGKSAIGATACFWSQDIQVEGYDSGGYYLVTQKLLQDQLQNDFPRYVINNAFSRCQSLKSASEYACPAHGNCAYGMGKKNKCSSLRNGTCAYIRQRNAWVNATVSVTNYPYLFTEHWAVNKLPPRKVLVLDECFPGETLVETETGPVPISKVKVGMRVVSFNGSSFELRRVVRVLNQGRKEIVRLTTEKGDIRCTGNHPFLTQRGWLTVAEIKPGDQIVGKRLGRRTRNLNEDQLQVVIGSYFGDGNLAKVHGGWRLRWTHCIRQRSYCEWKASIFGGKTWPVLKNGYSSKPAIRGQTRNFRLPGQASTRKKRSVPSWMLDRAAPAALAIWFMDDGSSQIRRGQLMSVKFHTESFSKRTCEGLRRMLRRFGISSRLCREKSKYWTIMLRSRAARKFRDLVAPYLHSDMALKLNLDAGDYAWNTQEPPTLIKVKRVTPVVTGNQWNRRNVAQECWDLEVEGTHNFLVRSRLNRSVTCWSKAAFVAHNCHTLERQILRFIDVSITQEGLRKWTPTIKVVPEFETAEGFAEFVLNDYLPILKNRLDVLANWDGTGSDDDNRIQKEKLELTNHYGKTLRGAEMIKDDPQNWVFWQETNRKGEVEAYAKPLDAAPFSQSLCFEMGHVCVHMSAYPGSKKIYCRSLGLDPSNVAWLNLNSTFPVSNREIFMTLIGSMSKRNRDQTLPELLDFTVKIMDSYPDTKGIIHCNSYDLGNIIYDKLQGTVHGSRLIYPRTAEERETLFARHRLAKHGTVIISPSMTEGFDFAEDLARWQIIAKVPFPYLGDRQVAAKKELSADWYDLQAVMSIIQACGRIVRSDTDVGHTYILDSDFINLWERHQDMFPRWWTDAVVWPKRGVRA